MVVKRACCVLITIIFLFFNENTYSQTEMQPWGNITGIRVGGQLMEFESSIRIVNKDWSIIQATALERQHPKYSRDGNKQMVTTKMDSFYFTQSVEENDSASVASVAVRFTSNKATDSEHLYFCLQIPADTYGKRISSFKSRQQEKPEKYAVAGLQNNTVILAQRIVFAGAQNQLQLLFDSTMKAIVRNEKIGAKTYYQLYIPLQQGSMQIGQTGLTSVSIKALGNVDKAPVIFHLNTTDTGRTFTGFGGNFRLQNPKTDPQVIDYCLQNMRVAYGRVEMPFQFWQPVKDSNPIDSAKAGKLHPHVKESMEMAARLARMNIPVILTAWSAPRWAISGEFHWRRQPGDPWGNPLDTTNMQAIYKSIADYIIYLRDEYGVNVKLFSFNESDLGINIRQTGEEHAQLIKGLGAYFQARGLSTKMLLGDNSDATTYSFIYPAMKDETTHPYIGAISFHSWRGWDAETLQKWADAASQMKLPLIVGEGSIDAAAWAYPAIFQEPTYAIKEINLYTRLMAICQPRSILQWQLTADYSPLIGGGIFGNNDSLHPGQRFWNLKQLASTPKDLSAMPVTTDKPYISCAAQGDNERHVYAIHIVNDGATRTATLTGLPGNIRQIKWLVTSKELNMQERVLPVLKGQVKFTMLTQSYTTLISE